MSGIPRHEVEASFRLAARDEWWLPAELLLGVVGYVAWVAVTWSVAVDVAGVLGSQVDADGAAIDPPVLALLAVLWLLVPALVGLYRLRARVLNFRGNLERRYRFERPGVLLVPPIVGIYVAGLAWVVTGAFSWPVYLLLVGATAFLVARTMAYSYRVFAFSRPLLTQLIALVTFALQAAAGLVILGEASEQGVLVGRVLEDFGLAWALGETTVAGLATPVAPALAVAVPVALVGLYLLGQFASAFAVRAIEPDVTPADIRGGQRYPPAVRTADGAGPSPRSTVYRSPKSPGPSGGSGSGSSSAGSNQPSRNGSGSDGSSASSDSQADAAGDDEDEAEIDEVSHTRVFTPPDGAEDGPAVADDVPNSSADGAGQRFCPACGQSFAADTDVRFCPNCGQELD